MICVAYKDDKEAVEWVSKYLSGVEFGLCVGMGLRDQNNNLIGGIIYSNEILDIKGKTISIEMTIATKTPRWCSRSNLNLAFAYPFIQLGVKRVQATCAISNHKVRNFLERLGFNLEGIGRELWLHGGDCALYSMLKHECKWINL